jgi:type I restriction enzyme, R subunit
MVWHESSTIQKALIDWAVLAGWDHIHGEDLPRNHHDVVIAPWVKQAITDLNPELAQDTASAELVLEDILTTITSAVDGLVAANERMTVMLRGENSFVTSDGKHVPRNLIDFTDPRANKLVVADEVTIGAPGLARRFDIVFYVNGFPLVVIETKNPVKQGATWLTAAKDIYDVYEVEYPNFFAPNVFNVATDGNELRVGAVRSEPNEQSWSLWGSTELSPTLIGPKRTEEAAKRLLTPESVLMLLETFTLFRHPASPTEVMTKMVARYPQVEGVAAIYDKVRGGGSGGLIWHHQGSGKTMVMAFAAFRLLKDPDGTDPTVIILCDRTQLVRQASGAFRTAGMPSMHVPESSHDLRKLVRSGSSGVIFTTIHKFADAGKLSDRDNIIVLVDEAHRTQEGGLGEQMRTAVPNATFFGMTGTPISGKERNTFKLFGDPKDPNFVMSRYEPIRSIVDGTTVPVSVEARLVKFNLNKEALDEAFDELAETEGISEEEKVDLSGRVSHRSTILRNPERIAMVCADIVDHYLDKFHPLDMKAQVVAFDREMVVAYADAIRAELAKRGRGDLEVGVNISVSSSKSENPALKPYAMTEAEEETQKRRFLDINDPLCFLVVTNKLMTGFDAPIEGVLYLDKPIKAQNLFQTITRPNRTWTNPKTGQVKKHGLVVDYIGLAKEIGKALVDPTAEDSGEEPELVDTEKLAGKFVTDLALLLAKFNGIDTTKSDWESLAEARERIQSDADCEAFIKGFIAVETVWEFLYPHDMLEPFKDKYRWLAALYESIKPSNVARTLLWERLGSKTLGLIHTHMTDLQVSPSLSRSVKLDAAGIELVKKIAEQLKLPADPKGPETITLEDVIESIESRVKRRLDESDSPVYKSLADRIEKLRQKSITSAEDSLEFLKQALEIARDIVAADKLAESGKLNENESLFDPKLRALSQIIEENKPDGLHVVVPDVAARIDAIVTEVAFTGWRESTPGDRAVKRELRGVLKQFALPVTGELFDRAYLYVRENY